MFVGELDMNFIEKIKMRAKTKKMKIKSVHKRYDFMAKGKLHTEDYYYKLYNDNYNWNWTDSMFEECEL